MARAKRRPENGRVLRDARPGRCRGCNGRFQPRVGESICRSCIRSIVANPNPWLPILGRLLCQ